jgi:hypothetical protein
MAGILSRDRATLVGDGCVVTAAAYAVVIGLSALLAPALGVLGLAVSVLAPIGAWVLHGRRLTGMAVLGGIVGGLAAGVLVMALSVLAMLLGVVTSTFTDSEFAGPLALLAVVGAAFVGFLGWLAVDAVRDLRAARAHARIDVIRLACIGVLVAFTLGAAAWVAAHPGDEVAEAPIFAMAAGLAGACTIAGAEALTALAGRGRAGSGVAGGNPAP